MNIPSRLRPAVLAVAALTTLAKPALAEEPATIVAAGEVAQTIVITGAGERRGAQSDTALGLRLSRRETPQSISTISRTQIEDFGLRGVNELLDAAPGINVERVETDRTYYTARGFDVTNFQFDGIGMPFTNGGQWGDLDTAVFDSVDVLRGANGLLSSTGNPSATINFVRKRPTADFQASAELTAGSWNKRRADADVSGALNASGTVRGRLIAASETKESYLDRYSRDKALLSALVDIDLGERTRLGLGYVQQRNNANSPMWGALPLYYSDGTPTDYPSSTSTAADWAYWDNTDRRAHAELTHDLGGGWQAKAVAMRRALSAESELFYVYGTPDRATGLGLFSYPSAFSGEYRQTMADLRVSGPLELGGRQHELMLGLSWGKEDAREHSGYGNDIGTPLPDLAGWNGHYPKPSFDASSAGSDFGMRRRSLFAAAQLNPADRLKLVVGANATHVSSSGISYGDAHDYERDAVTPYLGATFELNDQVSVYGSYTRIFNPQIQIDARHQVLPPIEGRNLEAGIKSEWLDKKLAASLAVFRTRQENTAEADANSVNPTTYHGVDATSTGFELELDGRVAEGWSVNASYTQFRLKGDDGEDARTYVPRRVLRLGTTWRVPGLPGLKLGGKLKWQDRTSTTASGFAITQKAYTVVDLMASYEINRQLTLALNIDNAGNDKHLTSLYWTQAYYAEPRSASVSLRWTY